METMQVSLTSQMTESGAVARLQISIRKLVQKQLDSGDINTQLLRAAFDLQVWFHDLHYPFYGRVIQRMVLKSLPKTQSTVAKQLDEALERAKSRKLRLNILQFATEYFPFWVNTP